MILMIIWSFEAWLGEWSTRDRVHHALGYYTRGDAKLAWHKFWICMSTCSLVHNSGWQRDCAGKEMLSSKVGVGRYSVSQSCHRHVWLATWNEVLWSCGRFSFGFGGYVGGSHLCMVFASSTTILSNLCRSSRMLHYVIFRKGGTTSTGMVMLIRLINAVSPWRCCLAALVLSQTRITLHHDSHPYLLHRDKVVRPLWTPGKPNNVCEPWRSGTSRGIDYWAR